MLVEPVVLQMKYLPRGYSRLTVLNIEKQLTKIFENTNEMKEGQIESKKQLEELTETTEIISNNFDENQKDRKEKERKGKLRDSRQKLRPIIVKFVRYNDRKNVFNRENKIKEKNIAITESLTAT